MKSKYLDIKNCHALLPSGHGLPVIQRLDNCLRQINDGSGPYHGLIGKLVAHNRNTLGKARGTQRLVKTAIDIAQALNVAQQTVQTQVAECPWNGPACLHTVFEHENGITWKTFVPLQFLLKGWGDANSGYQCYVHSISHNSPQRGSVDRLMTRLVTDSEDDFYYVGITGRNWLQRLSEHMRELRRGSRRRFYEAWRESLNLTDVLFVSALKNVNLSYEEAMNWEEHNVDTVAYGPNGLNMIPGGFRGAKFLHEHRITNRVDITLEERDKAIEEYIRQNPRKGAPNPYISALWEDDDYYERVMEANPKRLSRNQVVQILKLAEKEWSVAQISKEVGALNELQVKNVISGKTYTRYLKEKAE